MADNNFKATPQLLDFVYSGIIEKYGNIMNFEKFKKIIFSGIRGEFENSEYKQAINTRTIFHWLEKNSGHCF